MSHPFALQLGVITCIATDDFTGSDDLVGVLGADRFSLGQFSKGTSRDLSVERTIAPGVTTFTILEQDTISNDDSLITIDLTQDMDVDRVSHIAASGGAQYDVNFKVVSQADGP